MNIILSVVLCVMVLCLCEGRYAGFKGSWIFTDRDGDEVEVISADLLRRDRSQIAGGHRSVGLDRQRRCSCYCRRKWEREYSCCACGDRTCFPATARVTMETGDVTTVDSLQYGDMIMTVGPDGNLTTTEVVGYIQRQRDIISRYYQISTSHARLLLSRSHLVFVAEDGDRQQISARYASDVSPGDHVLIRDGSDATIELVQSVKVVGARGAYVPLTSSGTLLVDDVLVSCYALFPHDVAHVTLSPLRWSPWLLSWTPEDGTHPAVEALKWLGRSVLPTDWLFSGNHGNKTGSYPVDFPGSKVGTLTGMAATSGNVHSEL